MPARKGYQLEPKFCSRVLLCWLLKKKFVRVSFKFWRHFLKFPPKKFPVLPKKSFFSARGHNFTSFFFFSPFMLKENLAGSIIQTLWSCRTTFGGSDPFFHAGLFCCKWFMVADFLPIQKMQSMPPLSPLPPGLPTWPELPPPLLLLRELSLNSSSAGKKSQHLRRRSF